MSVFLNRSWLAAVLILLVGLSGYPAQSDDTPPKTLAVGYVDLDWFPFHYKEGETVNGFAIEALNAIFEQMRQDVDVRATTLSTGLRSLEDGSLDAYFALGSTPARQELYAFPNIPLFADETVLIARKDDAFEFNGDVSTLIGHRVGIFKDGVHGPAFDNMNGIIRVPFDSGAVAITVFIENLIKGEYRFIAVNSRAAITRYIKKHGLEDQIQIYELPVAIKDYYLVFSKQMPGVRSAIERFDKIHQLFRSTPEYEKLLAKYNLNRKLFPEWPE